MSTQNSYLTYIPFLSPPSRPYRGFHVTVRRSIPPPTGPPAPYPSPCQYPKELGVLPTSTSEPHVTPDFYVRLTSNRVSTTSSKRFLLRSHFPLYPDPDLGLLESPFGPLTPPFLGSLFDEVPHPHQGCRPDVLESVLLLIYLTESQWSPVSGHPHPATGNSRLLTPPLWVTSSKKVPQTDTSGGETS